LEEFITTYPENGTKEVEKVNLIMEKYG